MVVMGLSFLFRNIQKGIDEVNDELDEVPDNLKDAVQESIIYLVGNYSANESCKHPCDRNKCQNSAKCTPKGLGYDCQCLPGYSGPHCETGKLLLSIFLSIYRYISYIVYMYIYNVWAHHER